MTAMRKETDSLGIVEVPADKLWDAQTQRSLQYFSIGHDLIPREMIPAYATLKKAAAVANHSGKRLDERYKLIVQTCDEILTGRHYDMFPLHVWTRCSLALSPRLSSIASSIGRRWCGRTWRVSSNGRDGKGGRSPRSRTQVEC